MQQEKSQTPPITFFKTRSRLQGLGLVWGLCLANMGLILLLGGIMMLLSNQKEFMIVTLIMMGSAGSMVLMLLFHLQKLRSSTRRQFIEAKAYEAVHTPLIILTSDMQLCYGNQRAREHCWWAESIPFLKKVLVNTECRAALERLIKNFENQETGMETLAFQGPHQEEVWRIQTIPILGRKALWHCTNVTQEREENSKYFTQLNILRRFLNHAPDGLFSLDEKGTILFCNDKFADWLGYSQDQVEGACLSKLLAKGRGQHPTTLTDIQGKCDFISASSRVKAAFLEQDVIQTDQGPITHSLVNLYTPFASYSDLRRILEMAPFPSVFLDSHGKILDCNPLFQERFWLEESPIQGTAFSDCIKMNKKEDIKNAFRNYLDGETTAAPIEIHLNDAKESVLSTYVIAIQVKNKTGLFIQFHDITEQKRFEGQLAQSQKMQAVGQLAGGIAHDFNNLLTVMIGFCDLMLLRQTPGDQLFTDVMQIKQNALRATNLVRQLLAFSRKQPLEPIILNITDALTEFTALLRRLLGANVELKTKYTRDIGLILIDKGHFDQVIMNVMVNARDAMAQGGTITLTSQNCVFTHAKTYGHMTIPAGSYVLMEISDTGEGISPEILDRIFDPFFSTKEVGEGTGLGLSTVYGIVKQAGGFIRVESNLGVGTTFYIYLPHCTPEEILKATAPKQEKPVFKDLTGSNTILLVEDEDAVRLFSARALRSKGYTVIEAINGEEALEYMRTHTEAIDLVISDVVMPNMDGPTFVNEMSQYRENQKVLFISGYAEDTFYDRLSDDSQIHFLPKPFTLIDLATKVKELLSEDSDGAVQGSGNRSQVTGII